MDPKIFLLLGFMALGALLIFGAAVIPLNLLTAIPKFLLLILGMFSIVIAYASRYYAYLMVPLIKQRTKRIILSDQQAYWLATTSDAIVRHNGSDFVATAFINIPIYVSASEMTDEEKMRFAYQISRLVGVSEIPVRFSTELRVMDKDGYLKRIKDAIAESETETLRLMNQNAGAGEIARARGKLSMWKKVLDHISSNSSTELVTFAAVSALGGKEYEAITLAQQRAKEIMNGIGTILGVSPNVVVGEEILKLVEPEHLIPLSTVSEEISKRIERGEVS